MAFSGKNSIPSEVRSPPLPPGLIKRTTNRLVKIIQNVTIEPALFIMAFCSSMESIASKSHHSFNLDLFINYEVINISQSSG